MYETGRVKHFMKIVNFQISDQFLIGLEFQQTLGFQQTFTCSK